MLQTVLALPDMQFSRTYVSGHSSTARLAALTSLFFRSFKYCHTCDSHGRMFQSILALPDLQFSWQCFRAFKHCQTCNSHGPMFRSVLALPDMQFSWPMFQTVLTPPDLHFSWTFVSERSSTARHAVLMAFVSDRSSTARLAVHTDLCFRPLLYCQTCDSHGSTCKLQSVRIATHMQFSRTSVSDSSSTVRLAILTGLCFRPLWHC